MNTEETILAEGLAALRQSDNDIERLIAPRSGEAAALLEKYIAQIEAHNPAYGLVGTTGHRELIIRHILDSLAPLGILHRLMEDNTPQIADIGSGAGLPGIPLAIVLPRIKFMLIERMERRAEFLRNTVKALKLSNVRVTQAQLEELARGPKETNRFGIVTFRALKPLEPKLLKRLFKLCTEKGAIAAYKGRMEKIGAEMAALKEYPCRWEAVPCPVPMLDEERHLLVIRSGTVQPFCPLAV